jgi:hypothetical protein
MLLILILIAWLAIVTVLLAVCRAAARGEVSYIPGKEDSPKLIRPGLVVWDESAARALRTRDAAQRHAGPTRGRRLRGTGAGARRTTARGLR